MKSRVHLRVDTELLKKVRKLAKKERMTLTAMVEALFRSSIALDEEDERMRKQPQDAEQI